MKRNQGERAWNVPVSSTLFGKREEPLGAFEQEVACSATAEPLGNTWLINLSREMIILCELVTLPRLLQRLLS